MMVYVIGMTGIGLMPTSPAKARKLLKAGKAKVYCKRPFAIRLTYKTGSTVQSGDFGVDTGSQHIGIGVIANNKVLDKTEIELRSSMEKRSLIEKRKTYRRSRRYRKVRYRKPKFRFHTKRVYSEKLVTNKNTKHKTHWIKQVNHINTNRHEGWLPPSIQSKLDQHKMWIDRYSVLLPNSFTKHIEVARMDIARMKDPTIHSEQYQKGPMYDYENLKAYVFARDNYKCKCCDAKAGAKRDDGTTVKLIAHHVQFRSKGATDNPEFIVSVCDACHNDKNHKPGGVLYKWCEENKKFSRGYRDATLMNIVRKRFMEYYPDAKFTYGNITAVDRKALRLPKSHANDAVAIAANGKTDITDTNCVMMYKQVRKKKRSLHEANPRTGRNEPNRLAKRNKKNTKSVGDFNLWDKVLLDGQIGWITGFTGDAAYIKDENDDYVVLDGKSYKQVPLASLKFVAHNNNWIHHVERC